jgi:serpin B
MRSARLVLAIALFLTSASAVNAQDDPPDEAYIAASVEPAGKAAVAGINHFTLDLYRRIGKPTDNLFLSPASVSTAMALAYRGTRGRTADELRSVIHYSAPAETYLAAQASVLRAMTFSGIGRELSTNNGLWVQDGLAIDANYLADVATNAGAGFQRVDYRADPDRARVTINNWVSAKTNNRINDLLTQAS